MKRFRPTRLPYKFSVLLCDALTYNILSPINFKYGQKLSSREIMECFYNTYPRFRQYTRLVSDKKWNLTLNEMLYFDHNFIRENFQTIESELVARMFYEATCREDIKIFLSLKWGII